MMAPVLHAGTCALPPFARASASGLMLFGASVSCKGVKPFRKGWRMDGDMQNFSFEAIERENLREAGCAHRREVTPERLTSRHNNKAEVA
jgi:hypothetical protein